MFQCWEEIRAENTDVQDETSLEQSVKAVGFQIRLETEKIFVFLRQRKKWTAKNSQWKYIEKRITQIIKL